MPFRPATSRAEDHPTPHCPQFLLHRLHAAGARSGAAGSDRIRVPDLVPRFRRQPMNRLRLTIANLMIVVLYVGLGFAALRNADEFWASATFTLAILAVSVAVVVAVARKGRARLTWLGFAVFGWASLLIWLSTSETIDHSMNGPPVPVMTWGLRSLIPYFNQAPF